jgi:hypothetical protein
MTGMHMQMVWERHLQMQCNYVQNTTACMAMNPCCCTQIKDTAALVLIFRMYCDVGALCLVLAACPA